MLIKQSEATAAKRTVFFTAVNTADDSAHTSTISSSDIMLSKAGGTEAAATNSAVHIATGLHKLELTATECNTLGEMSIRLAKTGVYNDVRVVNVVAFDPYAVSNLGLTNLDDAISSRLAAALYQDLDDMLDLTDSIESGVTLRAAMRILAAFAAGKLSGGRTGTETFYAVGSSTKARITSTNDSSGNRTSVTVDGTDA